MRVCSLRNFTIMQASLIVAEQTLWLLFDNDVSYVAVLPAVITLQMPGGESKLLYSRTGGDTQEREVQGTRL